MSAAAFFGASLVGDSVAMQKLRSLIRKFAPYPRPALVHGERGTGKELVARLLHDLSPRTEGPFVVVNCGGVAGGLMASELFGHEKGAFTSATARRAGKLEQAHGGTLFLDEVGNMPLDLQKLLVRVIEYQNFERVGGHETLEVDVRVIAATNVDLKEKIRGHEFLPDLFDRLRFAEIVTPPLRERREDIADLARHFLEHLGREMPGLAARHIADEALVELTLRPWPGNVRELRAVIECAALSAEEPLIRAEHLPPARGALPEDDGDRGFFERVEAYERKLLNEALASSRNGKEAASRLKLGYDQWRRLARKHGVG